MTRDFDPDLFRELHPVYENEADAACKELWSKRFRSSAGEYTEAHRLAQIGFDLDVYPKAFPWRAYAILHPSAGANRWTALEHFLKEGFDHSGFTLSFGSDAAPFLFAFGKYHANSDDRLAIRAFELAITRENAPPEARKWLADAYMRHQVWLRGRALYIELIDEILDGRHKVGDVGPCESYVLDLTRGYLETCNRLDRWDGFVDRITSLHRRSTNLRDEIPAISETYFERRMTEARQYFVDGNKSAGDVVIESAISEVAALSKLCVEQDKSYRDSPKRKVVIIADFADSSSLPERIVQHVESLESLAFKVVLISLHAIDTLETELRGAQAAIFFAVPAFPPIVAAVVFANASNVATFYEIGELVTDRDHSPQPLSFYDGLLSRRNYVDMLVGAALYRGLASLCAYGIAPTQALASRLTLLVAKKRGFLLRIAAMPAIAQAISEHGEDAPIPPGTPTSFFIHSSRPYIFDQRDPTGAALIELMRARADIVVYVVGYLRLGKVFNEHRAKIKRLSLGAEYFGALRGCSVNLALDQAGQPGDCASERSWLDAASLRVATIAHASTAARERLRDGVDVVLASTKSEWFAAMTMMVDHPSRRQEIAAVAYTRAQTFYTIAASRADYEATFLEIGN